MKKLNYIKWALIFCLTINICQAQTHYSIGDNYVILKYNSSMKDSDSLQFNAVLKNWSEDDIWIMDNNIYNPSIENNLLYLNMGLDLERNSPMDLVPFPLRVLKHGDSISFNSTKRYDKYKGVVITYNYLLSADYEKILKKKNTSSAIGLLDYKRLMKKNYFYMNVACPHN